MLHAIIKEATKSYHSELEQLMYVDEIVNSTITLQQYKQLLKTNYLVNAACEDFLFTSLSTSMAGKLSIHKRGKTSALMADMEELNMVIPDKPNSNPKLVIPKSDAALLGALYVLEGATLGGNIIEKKLANNTTIACLNLSFHYYRVYGTGLGMYWKQFCEVLNQQPPETHAISVLSAQQMFEYIILIQRQTRHIES